MTQRLKPEIKFKVTHQEIYRRDREERIKECFKMIIPRNLVVIAKDMEIIKNDIGINSYLCKGFD